MNYHSIILNLAEIVNEEDQAYLAKRQLAFDNVANASRALFGVQCCFRERIHRWLISETEKGDLVNVFQGKFDASDVAKLNWSPQEILSVATEMSNSLKADPYSSILFLLQENTPISDFKRIFFMIFFLNRNSKQLKTLSFEEWRKLKSGQRPFAVYDGSFYVLNVDSFDLEQFIKVDLAKCWASDTKVTSILEMPFTSWGTELHERINASSCISIFPILKNIIVGEGATTKQARD